MKFLADRFFFAGKTGYINTNSFLNHVRKTILCFRFGRSSVSNCLTLRQNEGLSVPIWPQKMY